MKHHPMRASIVLLLLLCSLLSTSCVNVIEKIRFNKDGSGTYTFTFDMNGIKKMAGMLGEEFDEEEMVGKMSELNGKMDDLGDKIKNVPGITEVKSEWDPKEIQTSISFDFENIDALNTAMSRFYAGTKNLDNPDPSPFFIRKGKTISRTARSNLSPTDIKPPSEEEKDEDEEAFAEMAKLLFRDAYVETIIEFEQPVKSVSNQDYRLSDGHVLKWKRYIFSERDDDMKVPVTIKLK